MRLVVVDYIIECSYWLVVCNSLFLDPSNVVFGRFGLAALLLLPLLEFFLFVCFLFEDGSDDVFDTGNPYVHTRTRVPDLVVVKVMKQ